MNESPFTSEQLKSYLAKMLKAVHDQSSLDAFLAELAHFNYYGTAELRMKRRGYEPYAFSQYAHNPLKVTYLISDGASTGKALYTNLYKLFDIRVGNIYACEERGYSSKADSVRVLA